MITQSRRTTQAAGALAALIVFLAVFLGLAILQPLPLLKSVDEALMLALRTPGNLADPVGPAWLESAVRDVTSLGARSILFVLVTAASGYLLVVGEPKRFARFALFVVCGFLLAEAAKYVYARPRPSLVPHATLIASSSFPSAHALQSAVAYFMLAALHAVVTPSRAARRYVVAAAALVVVAVGASRVYLGVHWPTDVAAGWALGIAWAIAYWMTETELSRREARASGP